MKKILFVVLAMVLVLCGCSMKKAYKKAAPPDMDITEDDTTGNPVKEPEIPGNKADWTILMYVCGSDLESEDGFATDNFNEIKKIDFPDNINLVVEAGGTKKWHNGLDDNKLTRMVCKGNDWSVVGELKNASMGRTKTLSDFIKWGTKEYPADKYFLIIWNHGLIDFGGVAYDENYNDAISYTEFGDALDKAGTKFEMIGFDCCYCANYEMADTVNGYCNYLVASEDMIPAGGWDYKNWLGYLVNKSDVSSEDIGRKICDEYIKRYKYSTTGRLITMSLCDMGKYDKLNDNFEKMSKEINKNVSDVNKLNDFIAAVNTSETYEDDTFDLKSVVNNAKKVIPETYKAVSNALDDFVAYNVKGRSRTDSNGVAVYLPINDEDESILDRYAEWSKNASMLQLLAYIYKDNWTAPEWAYENGNEIINDDIYNYEILFDEDIKDGYVTLDVKSGMDYIADVQFELYLYDKEYSEITLLGYDNNTQIQDNRIIDNFGGYWLTIDGYYCSAQLVNSNDDSNIYIIPVKYNGIETELCMVYSFDDDEYTIAGVYSYSQNEESSRLLDLKEGDEIIPIFMCSKITDGEDEETYTYEGGTIEYKEGINIEEVSLFDGEYLFRFDITDVFGEHYYSKLYLVEIEGEDIYTSLFEC